MANPVHPDKRIDVLEKRLAEKDVQIKKLQVQNSELVRSIATVTAQVRALATSISRLR
jgi:uncharacterized coiled-coil protein SlyX